jgi:hypothetical protein
MDKSLLPLQTPQVPPSDPGALAPGLTVQLGQVLYPLLLELDTVLDKRKVAHLCPDHRRHPHLS